jgi:hypothetical protein
MFLVLINPVLADNNTTGNVTIIIYNNTIDTQLLESTLLQLNTTVESLGLMTEQYSDCTHDYTECEKAKEVIKSERNVVLTELRLINKTNDEYKNLQALYRNQTANLTKIKGDLSITTSQLTLKSGELNQARSDLDSSGSNWWYGLFVGIAITYFGKNYLENKKTAKHPADLQRVNPSNADMEDLYYPGNKDQRREN